MLELAKDPKAHPNWGIGVGKSVAKQKDEK